MVFELFWVIKNILKIDLQLFNGYPIIGVRQFRRLCRKGQTMNTEATTPLTECEACAMLEHEDRELTAAELASAQNLCGDCEAFFGLGGEFK